MNEPLMQEINQRRAVVLAVQSIYDNPLLESWEPMKYEIPIQAGAALTEQRIAPLTDMDGADGDHISVRNRRYSELTAMYWAWKHLKTPYIGICHYRRKFEITEKELEQCMDDEVDVIILREVRLDRSIAQGYAEYHYTYDWYYMLELIHQREPQFYDFMTEREHHSLHGACMAIYKREYLDQVCQFLFPLLDQFYRTRPEKKDVYQRRDVGFLAERLFSLYFEYQKENLRYIEVDLIELKSAQDAKASSEREVDWDITEVQRKIDQYLSQNQFTKSAMLLDSCSELNEDLNTIYKLMNVFAEERFAEKETFYDREELPDIESMKHFYADKIKMVKACVDQGVSGKDDQKIWEKVGISETAFLIFQDMEKENKKMKRKKEKCKKISVIVPCFNMSEYLEVAIRSVINQTIGMEQIQLILVDDASTDDGKTLAKMQQFEQEYPEEILVISLTENIKQGGARNIGLQYAVGEYVVYLDADDWYVPEAFQRLYYLATSYDCDVVEFGIRDVLQYPEEMPHIDLNKEPEGTIVEIIDSKTRKNFILSDKSHKGVKKCYRRSLLQDNDIRFAEKVFWEEPSFTYIVQFYEKRHIFLMEDLYYTLRHQGSTMESSYESKKMDNMVTIETLYQDLLRRGFGEEYPLEIEYLFFHWYFYSTLIFAVLRGTFFTEEEMLYIQHRTREVTPYIRANEYYQKSFRGKEMIGDLLFVDIKKIGIEKIRSFLLDFCKVYGIGQKNKGRI